MDKPYFSIDPSIRRKPIPMRRSRRSHTRRAQKNPVINMAEARREIVNALHLHRSSSSPSAALSSSQVASSRSQYCRPLTESLPLPEPIWSTTAPSVHGVDSPSLLTAEALEFEWEENHSSSYSWWVGFLETLDGKNSNGSAFL